MAKSGGLVWRVKDRFITIPGILAKKAEETGSVGSLFYCRVVSSVHTRTSYLGAHVAKGDQEQVF